MATLFKEFGLLDFLALGALAFLVIRGFIRGGSGEIGRLVGVLSGVSVGYFGFTPIARMVLSAQMFSTNPYAGRMIVFILVLVVCLAVWFAVSRLLTDSIRLAIPQPFDTLLGGVIGGVKAFVVVAVLCTLGLLNPREKARSQFQEESVTVQKIAPLLEHFTAAKR